MQLPSDSLLTLIAVIQGKGTTGDHSITSRAPGIVPHMLGNSVLEE